MPNIKIKFDIDAKDLDIVAGKTLTLQQQIKILKQEIQKPGYSPKELDILRSKLADTEDQFKATKARSGDFLTTLQLIPGPIGDIAAKLNGAISLIKQFGSFNLSDLKFQIKETINDIKDVGSAILKATGIQKLWTTATNALSGAFVKLGASQNAAAVASRALAGAIAATGIGLLVVALSAAIGKLMEYASNTKKAEKANDDFSASIKRMSQNLDDEIQNVKDKGEIRLLELKKQGAGEGALQKQREKNLKDEIAALEKSLSEKGKFNRAAEDLARNTVLTEEQVQQQSLAIAEAKNAANRRLISARIELQKLELQGEIDANERKKQEDEAAKQRAIQASKDAKDRAAEQKKIRDQQLKDIKDKADAAIQAIKDEKEAEEKRIEARKEFNRKIRDLYISLIDDEKARKKEELKAQMQDELDAMAKDLEFIKLSEEEKGRIRYAIREKYRKLIKGVDDEARSDEEKKDEAARMKRLELLNFESQGLIQGTKAYYQNKLDIINETQRIELDDLQKAYDEGKIKDDEYQTKKTAIEQKGVNQRKDLKKQELASIGQTISATIDALGAVTGALAASLDEEAKTSKSAFEKRKKLQIATAIMSAASGVVQILTQPSTLPSPADWIVKGLNVIALGIATKTNIDKIKATKFEGEGAAPAAKPFSVVATRAAGGIVTGAGTSTSDSIPAMLSNGEFVVNARSTNAFMPLLSAINDYGRRPRFAMGGLVEPRSPETMLGENLSRAITTSLTDRPIKTYVVGQDMSNQQQFDRTIKSRSLL